MVMPNASNSSAVIVARCCILSLSRDGRDLVEDTRSVGRSVGRWVWMASTSRSLFRSFVSCTSGFTFNPAAITTLFFLGIAAGEL